LMSPQHSAASVQPDCRFARSLFRKPQ